MTQDTTKRERGQFFTTTNPFAHIAFHQFVASLPPSIRNSVWLEPFAGSCNIPEMLASIGVKACNTSSWACFDIQPANDAESNTSGILATQRDTLSDFPSEYSVIITNPPYLARNSATRMGLSYPTTSYDDLYKHSLDCMLKNADYVAAIVPESFITADMPNIKQRLTDIISLNCTMFEDTSVPVCLALFAPEPAQETRFWSFSDHSPTATLGDLSNAHHRLLACPQSFNSPTLTFNSPAGQIGIHACDDTRGPSIKFVFGESINPALVKHTSRSITRVQIDTDFNRQEFILKANELLSAWRTETHDMFLTAFKGLRADRRYRRRLDYTNARAIINRTLWEINK